jgi:hypothetical protein
MADLTFAQLATACPANSIAMKESAGAGSPQKLYIDVSAITGDSNTLTTQGVAEFCIKLLKNANAAQTTVNADAATTPKINAFPQLSYSTPQVNTSGEVNSSVTASVTGVAGLNLNEISARTA